MSDETAILDTILEHHPDVQAIYLYGSHNTEYERPDSDVDIGLLLPPLRAKVVGSLFQDDVHAALERVLRKDVDLINLRLASTVLQIQILAAERRVYTGDAYAAAEFEMLTLSFYQKLNEERAGIIAEALKTRRFHPV